MWKTEKNKLENGLNYILKKRSSIWVMKILEGEGKTVGMKGAYLSERMAKGNAFLFDIYIYININVHILYFYQSVLSSSFPRPPTALS